MSDSSGEGLYRSTFDDAPVGIVHASPDGHWLRINQRVCDLLGYSREELQGEAGRARLQAEDAAGEAESLRRMAEGTVNRHVVDEKRYLRRDGSFLWVRAYISVHRDAEGRAQHFIMVLEDITERRTLEAQVRQANKMDAIGRLASGVAHDFNNLLTVILGFAELVSEDAEVPAGRAKDLKEIIKAATRATGITKQLLAFGRQQVLTVEPLDVNGLIADMTGRLRQLIGANIDLSLELGHDLSLALADRGQLEQVLMTLVANARDAMPGGGHITIETKDVELENSAFHDEAIVSGRYAMLAVSDTGRGIEKETVRRLFEPFYTAGGTGKGAGLGLSTTYGIVKQSKGYIWVYSELGRGTTFKVYLPRSASVATDATASAPAPAKGELKTVLLVEDEAGVRQLSKRILDRAGYRVLEAANGEDAERLFARHADAIDLVVTDVMMPGCTGPELLSRLQLRVPALRVLYMSGYSQQAAAGKGGGVDRDLPFLQKPFTSSELVRHVRDALDR